jgi:hypothetical protein
MLTQAKFGSMVLRDGVDDVNVHVLPTPIASCTSRYCADPGGRTNAGSPSVRRGISVPSAAKSPRR